MNWLTIAESLRVGQKTRLSCHECGNNNKAGCVSHSPTSFSFFCFACGHTEFKDKGKQTLAELKYYKELNDAAVNYADYKCTLPTDCCDDFPLAARLWLLKGGTTESDWRDYGIRYSPSLQRVVLPVYDAERNLEWYQLRAIEKWQRPKYLQPSADRSRVLFKSKPVNTGSRRCIITEDILSSIKTGKCEQSFSLLGTKPTTFHINFLSKFDEVTIWLDSDRAGQKGAYNLRKSLAMFTEVRCISTELDPKYLTLEQIKEKIGGL